MKGQGVEAFRAKELAYRKNLWQEGKAGPKN